MTWMELWIRFNHPILDPLQGIGPWPHAEEGCCQAPKKGYYTLILHHTFSTAPLGVLPYRVNSAECSSMSKKFSFGQVVLDLRMFFGSAETIDGISWRDAGRRASFECLVQGRHVSSECLAQVRHVRDTVATVW